MNHTKTVYGMDVIMICILFAHVRRNAVIGYMLYFKIRARMTTYQYMYVIRAIANT